MPIKPMSLDDMIFILKSMRAGRTVFMRDEESKGWNPVPPGHIPNFAEYEYAVMSLKQGRPRKSNDSAIIDTPEKPRLSWEERMKGSDK